MEKTQLQQIVGAITDAANILSASPDLTVEQSTDDRVNRITLLDALELARQQLLDGPGFITHLSVTNNAFACIKWLFHFQIPQLLPPWPSGANIPPALLYTDLATSAHVPEHQLRRIARMAILSGFFQEPTSRHLAHSRLSASIASDPGLVAWTSFLTTTSAPMAPCMVEATERWARLTELIHLPAGASAPPQLGPNQTAYNIAWNTELPLFKHVALDKKTSERYSLYMSSLRLNKGLDVAHLVEGFPWKGLQDYAKGSPVVLDVGGGMGQASFALAAKFDVFRFVVLDLPSVIKQASQEHEKRFQSRIVFQEYDFFAGSPPPPPHAFQNDSEASKSDQYDAILLRQIIHDWNDDNALVILRNVLPALKSGGCLVVMDTILPRPGDMVSVTEEAKLRVRDLTMLQAHNAYERELDEWTELFEKIDGRLKIEQVYQPFESLMAIMQVRYNPVEVGESF